MTVRRVALRELNPAIGGLIVRDRRTGDWLVLLSPNITVGERCRVFNQLMVQLDEWDRLDHSTAEVRARLAEMVVG
jgi:hypothetical protein